MRISVVRCIRGSRRVPSLQYAHQESVHQCHGVVQTRKHGSELREYAKMFLKDSVQLLIPVIIRKPAF